MPYDARMYGDRRPLILLVEDEHSIREYVAKALEEAGNSVVKVANLGEAQYAVGRHEYDLIVLDLGLPDGDGSELISIVRRISRVPIVILSACNNESNKIFALDAGADDYVTKPFSINELLARVRAHLRRCNEGDEQESSATIGDVQVDLERRMVTKNGCIIRLTKLEFSLLATLIRHRGKVLMHHQLLQEVWGPAYADRAHYLRIYMGRLRAKLEDDPARPEWLLTETGLGYRLRMDHR